MQSIGELQNIFLGEEVAVVLGGPSLRGFDFARLGARPVVAVNAAYRSLPKAAMVVSIDNRFYETSMADVQYMKQQRRVMIDRVGWNYADDIICVSAIEGMSSKGPHITLRGVSTGENSGMAATMLALACGAARVLVLGLDLKPGGGWWHQGYPPGWGPSDAQLDVYRAWWEWAATFEHIRARVVNCNPGSAVRGLPMMELP